MLANLARSVYARLQFFVTVVPKALLETERKDN